MKNIKILWFFKIVNEINEKINYQSIIFLLISIKDNQ